MAHHGLLLEVITAVGMIGGMIDGDERGRSITNFFGHLVGSGRTVLVVACVFLGLTLGSGAFPRHGTLAIAAAAISD